jgi:hypothetical protein
VTEPQEAHPLAEAIRQLLDAGLPTAVAVHLGGAPTGSAAPYVALYPDLGTESSVDRSLSDDVATDFRFQTTTVGSSAAQALLTAGKVNTLLLTTVPTLSDRRVRPIRQEGSQPVDRDDASTPVWFVTAQYLARSDRIA